MNETLNATMDITKTFTFDEAAIDAIAETLGWNLICAYYPEEGYDETDWEQYGRIPMGVIKDKFALAYSSIVGTLKRLNAISREQSNTLMLLLCHTPIDYDPAVKAIRTILQTR